MSSPNPFEEPPFEERPFADLSYGENLSEDYPVDDPTQVVSLQEQTLDLESPLPTFGPNGWSPEPPPSNGDYAAPVPPPWQDPYQVASEAEVKAKESDHAVRVGLGLAAATLVVGGGLLSLIVGMQTLTKGEAPKETVVTQTVLPTLEEETEVDSGSAFGTESPAGETTTVATATKSQKPASKIQAVNAPVEIKLTMTPKQEVFHGDLQLVKVESVTTNCEQITSTNFLTGPDRMIDHSLATTFACDGEGNGLEITLTLPDDTEIAQVGLANKYLNSRIIDRVTWIMPDGQNITQNLKTGSSGVQTIRPPMQRGKQLTMRVEATHENFSANVVAIPEIVVYRPQE